MSDEKTAFAGALAAMLGPKALKLWHGAIVVDQADDGSVGVKLPGAGAPSATAKPVPLLLGLPGFSARLKPNTEVSVAFHEGSEGGAFAALFPYFPQSTPEVPLPLPVYSVAFGGGTRPIARVDDSTDTGALIFRQVAVGPAGVPSTLTIFYRSPLGTETPVCAFPIPGPMIPLSPDPTDPTAAIIGLSGVITSGREEFTA
jgi:hypothetical protein